MTYTGAWFNNADNQGEGYGNVAVGILTYSYQDNPQLHTYSGYVNMSVFSANDTTLAGFQCSNAGTAYANVQVS